MPTSKLIMKAKHLFGELFLFLELETPRGIAAISSNNNYLSSILYLYNFLSYHLNGARDVPNNVFTWAIDYTASNSFEKNEVVI